MKARKYFYTLRINRDEAGQIESVDMVRGHSVIRTVFYSKSLNYFSTNDPRGITHSMAKELCELIINRENIPEIKNERHAQLWRACAFRDTHTASPYWRQPWVNPFGV